MQFGIGCRQKLSREVAEASRSLWMVKKVILLLIFHVPSQGGNDEPLPLLSSSYCWGLASLLTLAVSYGESLEPDPAAHFCTLWIQVSVCSIFCWSWNKIFLETVWWDRSSCCIWWKVILNAGVFVYSL